MLLRFRPSLTLSLVQPCPHSRISVESRQNCGVNVVSAAGSRLILIRMHPSRTSRWRGRDPQQLTITRSQTDHRSGTDAGVQRATVPGRGHDSWCRVPNTCQRQKALTYRMNLCYNNSIIEAHVDRLLPVGEPLGDPMSKRSALTARGEV